MICPNCKQNLKELEYKEFKIDGCENCGGFWFDRDELRGVKDKEDKFLKWLDIDLWKEEAKIKAKESSKLCPKDGEHLYVVEYGDSGIEVDICQKCEGLWLDGGEFRKIIDYLKDRVNRETVLGYLKDIGEEAKEIFTGPEEFFLELADLLIVMKLFEYRLFAKHSLILSLISQLPK